MNATLLDAPRVVAATAALALALVIALIAPTIAGDTDLRFRDRAASQAPLTQSADVPPATWARDPLLSPLETLREVPR